MLKLSKAQEKLVKQKNIGTSVIKGEAKSGKTTLAIGRMLYLLEHACKAREKILFVTISKEKSQEVIDAFNRFYALQNMSLFDEEMQGEVVIKDIDEWIQEMADRTPSALNLKVITEIPEAILQEVVKQAKKIYPRVKWLKKDYFYFIAHEINWIHSLGYFTFETYQMADRKGAQLKLSKQGSGRKAMWFMKDLVSYILKEEGQVLKSEVQLECLQSLKTERQRTCYQHMIIDDAGDYTKVQLELIRHLKTGDLGEVLFIMEKKESKLPYAWLSKGQSFKTIGYDMTGRVRHLTSRRKGKASQKKSQLEPTPLEVFIALQEERKGLSHEKQAPKEEVSNKLPWHIEHYKYINKITGVETIFQKDNSAGEVYIEEKRQEEIEELPIYSDIAAGMPIEIVEEVSDTFKLPSELLHHRKNTYILHVQGDSMTGVDIWDGDYVVIQVGNVNEREIAAVYYNGAITLKRIMQKDEHILLCSENPKYAPIVIEEGDFRVMGKLVGIIKSL